MNKIDCDEIKLEGARSALSDAINAEIFQITNNSFRDYAQARLVRSRNLRAILGKVRDRISRIETLLDSYAEIEVEPVRWEHSDKHTEDTQKS